MVTFSVVDQAMVSRFVGRATSRAMGTVLVGRFEWNVDPGTNWQFRC